jgi:hypothetical protein
MIAKKSTKKEHISHRKRNKSVIQKNLTLLTKLSLTLTNVK